jgi:hypothetical protein
MNLRVVVYQSPGGPILNLPVAGQLTGTSVLSHLRQVGKYVVARPCTDSKTHPVGGSLFGDMGFVAVAPDGNRAIVLLVSAVGKPIRWAKLRQHGPRSVAAESRLMLIGIEFTSIPNRITHLAERLRRTIITPRKVELSSIQARQRRAASGCPRIAFHENPSFRVLPKPWPALFVFFVSIRRHCW